MANEKTGTRQHGSRAPRRKPAAQVQDCTSLTSRNRIRAFRVRAASDNRDPEATPIAPEISEQFPPVRLAPIVLSRFAAHVDRNEAVPIEGLQDFRTCLTFMLAQPEIPSRPEVEVYRTEFFDTARQPFALILFFPVLRIDPPVLQIRGPGRTDHTPDAAESEESEIAEQFDPSPRSRKIAQGDGTAFP